MNCLKFSTLSDKDSKLCAPCLSRLEGKVLLLQIDELGFKQGKTTTPLGLTGVKLIVDAKIATNAFAKVNEDVSKVYLVDKEDWLYMKLAKTYEDIKRYED